MFLRINKIIESLGIGVRLFFARHPLYSSSRQYDAEQACFVNPRPLRKVKNRDLFSALLASVRGGGKREPSQALPIVAPDWQRFLTGQTKAKFIWFGHSTLLMRLGKTTLAVDPVLGPSVSPLRINMRRFQKPPAPVGDWPQVDWVLLSHNHYDHFETDTLKVLARQGARFIVPLGVAHYFTLFGIDPVEVIELDWWQVRQIADIAITFVPGIHTTGRGVNDKNKSLWGGYIIQQAQQTLYYSGDSSYGPHFAQIAERFPAIDVAFIENGQYDRRWVDHHMMPADTVRAAVDIHPQRIVPIHWGAYSLALHPWYEPVRQSIPEMQRLGLRPLTPLMGQVFDADTHSEEWFWQIDPPESEPDTA